MNYFTECFTQKFCSFQGRARRQEYWMFVLFSMLTVLATMVISAIIPILGIILYVGFALASLLPGLGVCVRRLHDT